MEFSKEQALAALYSAIDGLNQTLDPEARLDKSPDTPLFGSQARIDSLGVVNLVLAAEQKLTASFGKPVSLAQSLLADGAGSPPATVGALADLVIALLYEGSDV